MTDPLLAGLAVAACESRASHDVDRTGGSVFSGVNAAFDVSSESSPASVLVSRGNVFPNSMEATGKGAESAVFTPPYPYALDAVDTLAADIEVEAGPR